ncbi:RNA polymerase subunit sigma-24 [Nocardioides sp. Soil796]|nr:RNA polymerase subunit sigma-24 [Nocardioides sp. Soil796]
MRAGAPRRIVATRSVGVVTTDPFVTHRGLLFTVAYEMLGTAADAEDVVQETWLKWTRVDRAEVRDPRAFLVRIVTRAALDQLRTASRRREEYVGQWLPEPLLTSPDIAEDVELADSLSMAMLLVLETLTPTQRAVFVLHDVFDFGYDELAEAVGKSEAAVRQIASRARAHVAERKPRGAVSRADTQGALEAFQRAVATGEIEDLLDILAPDVVVLGDGGGIKQAVPNAVCGADKVGRLLRAGLAVLAASATRTETVTVNGWPALVVWIDDELDSVVSLRVEEGLVSGIYALRNPEKLSRILQEVELSR